MKLFFPIFLVICFIFYSKIRRTTNVHEEDAAAFWARESEANLTRKKNIDNLDYITIPLEKLPFLDNPPKNISTYEKDIRKLSEQKILNLSGISNTELKLTYGAANFTRLSEYDENYSRMITTFYKWASALLEKGYTNEAQMVLETAVETGCDSGNIFLSLNSIYRSKGIDKSQYLIDMFSKTNSPMKDSIISRLKSS